MFLFHVDNKVFSQITEKIADKSRITGNWIFTDRRKNKSKITDRRKNNNPNHVRSTEIPLSPSMNAIEV